MLVLYQLFGPVLGEIVTFYRKMNQILFGRIRANSGRIARIRENSVFLAKAKKKRIFVKKWTIWNSGGNSPVRANSPEFDQIRPKKSEFFGRNLNARISMPSATTVIRSNIRAKVE